MLQTYFGNEVDGEGEIEVRGVQLELKSNSPKRALVDKD